MKTRVYKGIKTDSGDPVCGRRGGGINGGYVGMMAAGFSVIAFWEIMLPGMIVIASFTLPIVGFIKLMEHLQEKLNEW